MSPNAFLERYEKPNYKLHIVIFLIIVAVSVFLSTQVEKSRDKTNVAAMKSPVPIDSVTLADKTAGRQITPKVKPSITTAPVDPSKGSVSVGSADTTEQDSAIDVQQTDEGTSSQLAENQVAGSEAASKTAADERSDEQLEEVFDQQHNRFLQTLAKTADIESKETAEVRKIKQAIRQDKPLQTAATAIETKSTQKKQESSSQQPEPTVAEKASNKSAKQDLQRPASRQARAADSTSLPVAMRQSQPLVTPARKLPPGPTTKELNRILSNFTNSYNKGNIGQLMALFDDNARTNDRSSKRGIQADYAELFNNTKSRKLMINDVNWRVNQGKAEGAATFEVVVRPKNSTQASRIRGSIRIVAEKNAQGVYITRLVHDIQQ